MSGVSASSKGVVLRLRRLAYACAVASAGATIAIAFVGISVGPFHGRDASAAANVEQPPDGELVLLAIETEDDAEVVRGRYAWAADPEVAPGARCEYGRLTAENPQYVTNI